MAKIKVTGFIDTDDLEPSEVDLGHEMGLSSEGFDEYSSKLDPYLADITFKLVRES